MKRCRLANLSATKGSSVDASGVEVEADVVGARNRNDAILAGIPLVGDHKVGGGCASLRP